MLVGIGHEAYHHDVGAFDGQREQTVQEPTPVDADGVVAKSDLLTQLLGCATASRRDEGLDSKSDGADAAGIAGSCRAQRAQTRRDGRAEALLCLVD